MSKRKTNVEFVTELMEFSNHGALMQAFVITAIQEYAETWAVQRLSDGGMISPNQWQACAEEVLAKLEEHYK